MKKETPANSKVSLDRFSAQVARNYEARQKAKQQGDKVALGKKMQDRLQEPRYLLRYKIRM